VLGLGAALAFRFSWGRVAERIGSPCMPWSSRSRKKREIVQDMALGSGRARARGSGVTDERVEIEGAPRRAGAGRAGVLEAPKSERVARSGRSPCSPSCSTASLPQVDLLDGAQVRQESVSPETLDMTSRMIEKKLKDFGVEVWVIAGLARAGDHPLRDRAGRWREGLADRRPGQGPGAQPEPDVDPRGRDDSRQELHGAGAAQRQAPVDPLVRDPGLQVYNEAKSLLTMGLGKDIVGNPVVADLAKMPHVLVAGTTGSGKSVGINAMILSLLYKADARDVRLLMIDPKMLEMSVYEGIPHLLAPVVTDMRQAAHGLTWCVAEMERRYKLHEQDGRAQPGRLQRQDRRGQGARRAASATRSA
jgi:S-DNA-T family DNA segregation ATPase FtsK/SpoIIIE